MGIGGGLVPLPLSLFWETKLLFAAGSAIGGLAAQLLGVPSLAVHQPRTAIPTKSLSSPPAVPAIPEGGFTNCCEVNDYIVTYHLDGAYTIDPPTAVAIRDDRYKLVENTYIPYLEGQA